MIPDVYSMEDIRRNAEQAREIPTLTELRVVAREIETMIRSRLAGGHQKEVALDIGISETKMSRAVTGDGGLSVSDFSMLLAALRWRGIHVVDSPVGVAMVPEEKLAALTVLAREALK